MQTRMRCEGNLPRFQEPLQLEGGWTGRYPRFESVVEVDRITQGREPVKVQRRKAKEADLQLPRIPQRANTPES